MGLVADKMWQENGDNRAPVLPPCSQVHENARRVAGRSLPEPLAHACKAHGAIADGESLIRM